MERPCVARGTVASGVERARGRHKGSAMEPARSKQASGASAQQTTRGAGRMAGDYLLHAERGRARNERGASIRRATIGSASDTCAPEDDERTCAQQASERSERANSAYLAPLRMRPRTCTRDIIRKPLYIGAYPTYRGGNSTAVLLYRSLPAKTAHSTSENIGRPSNSGTLYT